MPMPRSLDNGHYIPLRPIGTPGMSEVYLCKDTRLDTTVVVKLVRISRNTGGTNQAQQDALDNFKREAGVLARVQHSHVVTIFNSGEEKRRNHILPYMVMPYCKEGSLQDWLKEHRPAPNSLEVKEVAKLLTQAGEALNHLHENGIVHRDIKSTNFLVANRQSDSSMLPHLLLADFGFAQLVGASMSQDNRGTYLYKAPEQWANARPVFETDQYQLAIMAYYLLTRKHPFEDSKDEVKNKHVNDVPPAPSIHRHDIPRKVDKIILRALEKRPGDRYPSVQAFTKEFERAVDQRFRPIILALIAALVITTSILFFVIKPPSPIPCASNSTLSPYPQSGNATSNLYPFVNVSGIKESMKDACGNVIGLSAGATILDINNSADIGEMQNGATALRNDDISGALAHFQTVTANDPSNAEAGIYAEDLQVITHNLDYIAVVLGLDITSGRYGSSRDSMRGAYLAQKAYNQSASQCNCHPSLVVILANGGANHANTNWVAQQILALKKENPHIVGVVGWSISSHSVNANAILAHQPTNNENIFMLAPSSSSTDLTRLPYFLRMVPSDITLAQYMADYAYSTLHYKKIVILYTSDDNSSVSSASAFEEAFRRKNGIILAKEGYSSGDASSLGTALSNALQSHPDTIYFTGIAPNAAILLSLPKMADLPAHFKILGGASLASQDNYPANQPNLDRLVLSTFSSQDEWAFLHDQQLPFVHTFLDSYTTTFKTSTLGPNVMQVYDAVDVFLQAYQQALANGGTDTCLPCALQKAFSSMNGEKAWQGVSGQLTFDGSSTEPIDRVIWISHFENSVLKTIDYRGCFLVDRTDCKN